MELVKLPNLSERRLQYKGGQLLVGNCIYCLGFNRNPDTLALGNLKIRIIILGKLVILLTMLRLLLVEVTSDLLLFWE
jgi:hypothetical protein